MATVETTGRRFVRAERRAEGVSRARALLRREGDQAARGGVRRAPDPCRRHHRQGARGGPDEPASPRVARRPRALGVRRDARRGGAQLGLLRHRHVDPRERPRRGPILIAGTEEQKKQWLGPLRRGAGARLLRPHRAGRRVGRLRDPDDRRPPGRRLRRQRLEDVHHERRVTPRGSSASPLPSPAAGSVEAKQTIHEAGPAFVMTSSSR